MDASGSDPQRAWKFRPFYEEAGSAPIDQLMKLLDYDVGTDAERRREREHLELEIEVMRNSPFHPHAIARLRPEAYQKATVMKMLDVLIEWGDSLFALDTIESITEATQIYLLAAAILGRKPIEIDHRDVEAKTFYDLSNSLDDFSNAIVAVESVLHEPSRAAGTTTAGSHVVHPIVGPSLYFCVPPNPKLLGYWDTVADRLFKIRHCQNLEGIVRQLPLFEPPIDPALLVRAAAAGVDIRAALSDINAPLPIYRFSVLAQRAMELSNEVRALGGALLAALEKKDAETIALLRSGHEVTMQSRIAEVRQQQVDEASASLDALRTSRTLAEEREAYYRRLIANPLNENEQAQLTKMQESFAFHMAGDPHREARRSEHDDRDVQERVAPAVCGVDSEIRQLRIEIETPRFLTIASSSRFATQASTASWTSTPPSTEAFHAETSSSRASSSQLDTPTIETVVTFPVTPCAPPLAHRIARMHRRDMNNENIDRNARRRLERRFVRHARALLRAAWRGCIEQRDTVGEESYVTRCAVRDIETGACMVLTREIGRIGSEIPVPIGHPVLHLAITTKNAIPPFALAKLIGECFRSVTSARDIVWSIARTAGDETRTVLHLFALCDARWKPIVPPSWMRDAASNDPFGFPAGAVNDNATALPRVNAGVAP